MKQSLNSNSYPAVKIKKASHTAIGKLVYPRTPTPLRTQLLKRRAGAKKKKRNAREEFHHVDPPAGAQKANKGFPRRGVRFSRLSRRRELFRKRGTGLAAALVQIRNRGAEPAGHGLRARAL